MSKTCLILSFLFLVSCDLYPEVPFYVTDLHNQVCAVYKMMDRENFEQFKHVEDLQLKVGGPCDGMVGHSAEDFNLKVKPWAKDQAKNQNKKPGR